MPEAPPPELVALFLLGAIVAAVAMVAAAISVVGLLVMGFRYATGTLEIRTKK